MPRPRKTPERRQNRATKDSGVALEVHTLEDIPSAPDGIAPELVESWREYWESPLAKATDAGSKLNAATRLWQMYDLRNKHHAAYCDQPLVTGSQGQQVLNPLGRQLTTIEGQIMQLEDRLGLNPKAQLALGVTWAEGQKQLRDLADRVFSERPKPKPSEAGDDPRKLLAVK